MPFDPTLAAIRFGTGLSPLHTPAQSLEALLADLSGPDHMARRHPIPGFHDVSPSLLEMRRANRERREARGTADEGAAEARMATLRQAANDVRVANHQASVARKLDTAFGLGERLTDFWADHFTVKSRNFFEQHLITPYVQDAIRPHVAGRFPDMLRAVVLHPMMLLFLEQWRSTGPQSALGLRTGRGLNENLARELLELHLLGVDGGYGQHDVRELAELLTGLTYQPHRGFFYDPRMAEPGGERVLGVTFSGAASLDTVLDALDALALHPDTAAHLARKMAVHFVRPDPAPGMVAAMARSYLDTGGNLLAMTEALLRHGDSWSAERHKVRLPLEFIAAAMRALGVTGDEVMRFPLRRYRNLIRGPSRVMGQPWETPIGPDGWSEEAADWIIPQAMAARISWAMRGPSILRPKLPDPRDFARTALGDTLPQPVLFAAAAAETTREGVGLVLASPAFQRR